MSKILIIEDDRFISDMYAETLRMAGHEVEVSVTGPSGLAQAQTGNFKVILLDVMLPDETGDAILTELRGHGKNLLPESKILVMTNYNLDDSTREAMERKADGFMIKADITPSELVEIIKALQ